MYPSDLNDSEWNAIKEFFKRPDPRGRKSKYPKRDMVNAILYVVKTGAQWHMLPNDFPPWNTVYYRFKHWSERGIWEKALDFLNRWRRRKEGKKEEPTYGVIDSQSVKTIYASEERGVYQKIKGRNRHVVTDTLGNLWHVKTHSAQASDTKAGCDVLREVTEKLPSLEAFCADEGYRGTCVDYVEEELGRRMDIVKKEKGGFKPIPKRWVGERTFAWFGLSRRLSKDYEILTERAENLIRIAMIKLQVAKVA